MHPDVMCCVVCALCRCLQLTTSLKESREGVGPHHRFHDLCRFLNSPHCSCCTSAPRPSLPCPPLPCPALLTPGSQVRCRDGRVWQRGGHHCRADSSAASQRGGRGRTAAVVLPHQGAVQVRGGGRGPGSSTGERERDSGNSTGKRRRGVRSRTGETEGGIGSSTGGRERESGRD